MRGLEPPTFRTGEAPTNKWLDFKRRMKKRVDLVLGAPRESGLRVRAADREGVVGLVHAVGRGLAHAEGVATLVIALGFRAISWQQILGVLTMP